MKKQMINVLLVEDTAADALLVQESLLRADDTKYNFMHALSLGDARKLLDVHNFDVILLDLTLPDSQGIETVNRAMHITPHLPIVVLTGIDDNGLSIRALQAGAQDYLIKGKTDCTLLSRSIQYAIERRRLEALLRISEDRYRTFFENTKDIFYRTDIKGAITFISHSVKNYGYSVNEVIGKDVRLFYDNPAYRDVFLQLLTKDKSVHDFELELKRKDGSKVYASVSAVLILDGNGKPLYIDGILRDITDRKKAEQIIKQNEEKLKNIIENTFDIIYTFSTDGTITFISPNVIQYGYAQEDIIGHNILEFVHPDDREKVQNSFKKKLETGEGFITAARLLKKNGDFIYIEEIGKVILTEGEPSQLTGVIRDVTDRIKAEESHRESESKFRAMAESSSAAIFIYKGEKFVYVNKASEALTGYTQDELIGMTFWDVVHPDYQQLVKERALARQQNKTVPQRYEFKIVTKQGEERWADISVSVIQFNGESAVVCMAFDITERVKAEMDLRKLKRAIEQSPASIVITNKAGDIEYVNPKFEQITGYTYEEVIGQNPRLLKSGKTTPDEYKKLWETITSGAEWRGEFYNKKKNGEFYWESASISSVTDTSGNITHFTAVKEDITEKKLLEERLLRSQRMESIGTLAGGVAHDLNNVLAPILLSIEILKKSVTSESEKKTLEVLEASAKRGSDIVKQVLSFARGVEGKLMILQPKHIVKEIATIITETFPRNISVEVNSPKNIWAINSDPTQIHQLLMNLCVNARDAMPHGGKLTISIENKTIDEQYARMNLNVRPGQYVIFSINDTGIGIPPEIRERIFEPFFTTKEIGKGTGLGLSTTYTIVKNHRGFINVYSEPRKGSSFKVYLPAHEAQEFSMHEQEKSNIPTGNGELILVVDDEASVAQITKQTLEVYGYKVITASDGIEAIALYASQQNDIALVITDMMMPFMDGKQTILTIRKFNPIVKIIASSGFFAHEQTVKSTDIGANAFLAKPYTAEKLLEVVSTVLKQSV